MLFWIKHFVANQCVRSANYCATSKVNISSFFSSRELNPWVNRLQTIIHACTILSRVLLLHISEEWVRTAWDVCRVPRDASRRSMTLRVMQRLRASRVLVSCCRSSAGHWQTDRQSAPANLLDGRRHGDRVTYCLQCQCQSNIYIAPIIEGRIWGAGVWVTRRDRQKRKGEI